MEAKVAEMNKEMKDLSLEQLDVLWEEAETNRALIGDLICV